MKLDIIKNILENNELSDEIKEIEILSELSKDEDILIYFLKILMYERQRKKECMFEMQTIISDLHIIRTGATNNRWNGGMIGVVNRIEPLFKKWKGLIWHQTKGNFDNL